MQTTNWPHGTNLGHPNFTGRIPRVSRYDGQGGWAKDSTKIPAKDAAFFIAITAVFFAAVVVLGTGAGL